MSIASEITRINTNIANSYTAVENKNGTLPQVQNSANLASAIDSIQSSNIIGATAEGESLSLANTKAMPYSDYVVKGKSTQSGEPSPSNPSEIHSVADDVNLLENMTIYNSNHYISPLLKLNPGTYTFNYTGDSAPGIYIRKNDGSNPTNGTVVDQKYTANNITFSISETGNYYIHLYSMTMWEQLTMNNPKLQKGSISTPYSPYNQGTVTIKQRRKNLFDIKTFLSDNNVTYTENTDKSLTFTTSSALYLNPLQFSNENITVSLSGILTTLETMSNSAIQVLNSNNVVVGNINLNTSKVQNISGCKIRFNMTSNKIITLKNIQLEERLTSNRLRTISRL